MVSNSYQSIPQTTMERESFQEDNRGFQWRSPRLLIIAALATVAVMGGMALVSFSDTSPESISASLIPGGPIGNPASRDCTFDECYASHCNQEVAPFTCLFHNGGPHGGCSPVPWNKDTCDDSCSLTDCHELAIPDSVKGCTDPCPPNWCQEAGGQVCPPPVPYQCMAGSARFGCSADSLTWALYTDGATCSSCCDASSC